MGALATLDRSTHTYTAGGVGVDLCVSDVLRLSGICQPYPDNPVVMGFVEHARELGETVHEWCDYLDEKRCDYLDNSRYLVSASTIALESLEGSEPLPYLLAYQRFRKEKEVIWEAVEQSVVNVELGVAGTLDRIGTMKHGKTVRPVIVDIKTPKTHSRHWGLQLSAYQYLANRLDCSLFVVHLASDGSYKVRPYESDIDTFLAAVTVAKWRLKNGAKV